MAQAPSPARLPSIISLPLQVPGIQREEIAEQLGPKQEHRSRTRLFLRLQPDKEAMESAEQQRDTP